MMGPRWHGRVLPSASFVSTERVICFAHRLIETSEASPWCGPGRGAPAVTAGRIGDVTTTRRWTFHDCRATVGTTAS